MEIKPCPFCGGAATVVVEDGVKVVGEAISKAINLWNQRS